jgi:hypothetical protein
MRLLTLTFAAVAALLTVTACNGKSDTSDQSNATATTAAATSEAATTNPAATSAAAGDVPTYPGAVSQSSGSTSNMMGSAAGQVLSTDDSFDKVYTWYQQNLPAGSEKTHVTSPVESAVFMVGETGKAQTSVTLGTAGGKTVITIGHVNKM